MTSADLVAALRLRDRPVLVVSPHLDDAWLGTAALLQSLDATVWTVFAGEPDPVVSTEWDTRCGFPDSRATMRTRRAEDDAAFAGSRVKHEQLPFIDAAYSTPAQSRRSAADIARRLERWLEDHPNAVVCLPVGAGVHVSVPPWQKLLHRAQGSNEPADGSRSAARVAATAGAASTLRDRLLHPVRRLLHADAQRRRRSAQRRGMATNPDHLRVRNACVPVALARPTVEVLLWEELPYLWHAPGADQAQAMARQHATGLGRYVLPVDVDDKYRRIAAYVSQLDVLDPQLQRLSRPGHLPIYETYWLLRRTGEQ